MFFSNYKRFAILSGIAVITVTAFFTLVSCPLPIDESLVTVVEDEIEIGRASCRERV